MKSFATKYKGFSLTQVLEEIDRYSMHWIIKRLSGNDTGLTGGHQSGVYYPKTFFEYAFPEILTTEVRNPTLSIEECYFPDFDHTIHDLHVKYYNNKFFGGTRNELRITNWGGKCSPTQDVEQTGAIFLFAVLRTEQSFQAIAWVAQSLAEEEMIEAWLGEEVDPKRFYQPIAKKMGNIEMRIPESWFGQFPSGSEIFQHIVQAIPRENWSGSLDALLLKRRDLEYHIYQQIETKNILPIIQKGFDSVEHFMKLALSVANRRKSRGGKSLELNLEHIFQDEKLYFQTQQQTEHGKKPDYLFPSAKAYHTPDFPEKHLHLVAAKTTCKDRWRQVIDEADRIRVKHLFTLQEGVSSRQMKQMEESHIQLVVPEPYLKSYPKEWRSKILTLEKLTKMIRNDQANISNIHQWIA